MDTETNKKNRDTEKNKVNSFKTMMELFLEEEQTC